MNFIPESDILNPMKKAQYTFITNWHFDAPIHKVWPLIYNSLDWPRWWKGVEKVEVISLPKDGGDIGSVLRYTWKSALPYRLTFDMTSTEIIPQQLIRGTASGELEGTGTWTFKEERGGTSVTYVWEVSTSKAWMNLFAPLTRPFFNWNHDVVMGWGEEGLERELRKKDLIG